jgi:DNA-binding SARP family transcriptional activator/predicted ATPase
MVRLKLTLLGGFEVRLASGTPLSLPTKKAQGLLAYLATRPGQGHSRDKLAALLWGDRGDGQARDGLRHVLVVLRRALASVRPSPLRIEGQTVTLDPAAVEVDSRVFEARLAEGTSRALEEAAGLYQGDLLHGFTLSEPLFEEWLVAERERLREAALEALGRLLAHQAREASTERAIQTAMRLLALDPLQEGVHRTLMRLYARQGRRGSALRQYQVCVAALRRELGTEPEAETKSLYQDLLRGPAEVGQGSRAREHAPAREQPRAPVVPDLPAAETPLVGRQEELARLRQALDDARRGRGQVVTVVGEAGIGKTRLVAALAAEALSRECRVLVGRCHESDAILPFGPWVEACRAGAVSADEEILGALHPRRRAELTRLLPEAGATGLPPASESALPLFESVAALVEQAAVRRPLVLVLEDVHWADEMSLRLLAFVSRRLGAWPALLVATARAEELADASMARRTLEDLARASDTVPVVLGPLSRPDTGLLVSTVARAAPRDARLEEQVWAMSEGNPFVVVEAIRALERDRARNGAPDPPGAPALPARVRDLVARRLDRLGVRSQQLTAVAAVIGRQFDFALLRAAGGVGEREAAESVEEMVRHHVLQAVGNQLDFTHDRMRDVAYARLLPPRRRLLHRAVAEALEALGAGTVDRGGTPPRDPLDEQIAQLAHHYTEAGLAGPAVSWWQRASERSSARSAYGEAVAQCGKALELLRGLPEMPGRIQQELLLQTTLGPALMATRGPATPGAEAAYERALELCRAVGDTPQLFAALMGVWQYYLVRARPVTARELGERLLGLARTAGDPALLVQAHRALGEAFQNLGELVLAREHLARGSALYDAQHHRSRTFTEPGVFCLAFASWVLWPLGYPEQALHRSQAALTLARELGYPHTLAAVLFFAAMVHTFRGERGLARERAEETIALGREQGLPHWVTFGTIVRGWALAMQGQGEQGIVQIEQGLAAQSASGAGIARPCFLVLLAEAHAAGGRAEAGLGVLADALALVEHTGERYQEAEIHRLRGELLLRGSAADAAGAERAFEQALAVARRQQARSWELRAATSLARLWRREGKHAAAAALLAPVHGWFTEGLDTPDLRDARALLEDMEQRPAQ